MLKLISFKTVTFFFVKIFFEFTHQHLLHGLSYTHIQLVIFNLQKMNICLAGKGFNMYFGSPWTAWKSLLTYKIMAV